MLRIDVPNASPLRLEYLVCDLNGTLALDGALLPGVAERLGLLAERLAVCILTADTHGSAAEMADLPGLRVERLGPGRGDDQKRACIERLGAGRCVAMGNGRNDAKMLGQAVLGIVVIGREGAAREALLAGDVVCYEPTEALDLLLHPKRLVATLRW